MKTFLLAMFDLSIVFFVYLSIIVGIVFSLSGDMLYAAGSFAITLIGAIFCTRLTSKLREAWVRR